jgi:hypothetical protein
VFLVRSSTKACLTPGSLQQFREVQTDNRANILEQKRIPHNLGEIPVSMKMLLFHKRRVCGIMSMKKTLIVL